jgi:hypothetical protein
MGHRSLTHSAAELSFAMQSQITTESSGGYDADSVCGEDTGPVVCCRISTEKGRGSSPGSRPDRPLLPDSITTACSATKELNYVSAKKVFHMSLGVTTAGNWMILNLNQKGPTVSYRLLIFSAIFLSGLANRLCAQTIPPGVMDSPASAQPPDQRKVLTKEESATRIRKARELLRKGADARVRGADYAVDLDLSNLPVAASMERVSGPYYGVEICETPGIWLRPHRARSRVAYCLQAPTCEVSGGNSADRREIDVVLALCYYLNNDFRSAFNAAERVHQVNQPGPANLEAALLKSLVFETRSPAPWHLLVEARSGG